MSFYKEPEVEYLRDEVLNWSTTVITCDNLKEYLEYAVRVKYTFQNKRSDIIWTVDHVIKDLTCCLEQLFQQENKESPVVREILGFINAGPVNCLDGLLYTLYFE